MFKARSRAKQSNAKRKENCLDADSEIIQEEKVSLPLLPVLCLECFYEICHLQCLQLESLNNL